VTPCLKGHLLVTLSEGASVMADLNQNIDMTMKKSYKWSGVWQEKGLTLVPKRTRVDWNAARNMGVALVPQ
jgi:hypothetical protein